MKYYFIKKIEMIINIIIWSVSLFFILTALPIQAQSIHKANVHVRIFDTVSNEITGAMVSIVGESDEVRLPPDGRILDKPSTTSEFYSGITFQDDKNWIGPVRKTMGIGDNEDRSYVYELLPSIPYWKEPVIFQTSGDFTIDLPEGKWRISVDRGMEYIPIFTEFEVTEDSDVETIDIHLTKWIDMPSRGWYSGDVHVHHPTIEEGYREFLLKYARATDLHIVNVLEMGHHEGTDFHQHGFGEEYRVCEDDYCLVSGQEDPRSNYGHIIGLNIDKMVRDLNTYDYYDLTFEGLADQPQALVGFAHFSWNGGYLPRGFPWLVTTKLIDFVELLQFSKINKLDYYEYLNLGFKLTAAAGSDVPWGSSMGEVRTFVYTGTEFNIDQWFSGLKEGHSFVSNGPMLDFSVNKKLPGSEIDVEKGEIINIYASVLSHPSICVPKSLTITGTNGTIKEIENLQMQSSITINESFKILESQWIAVSTSCHNDAVAHTSPVYVLVDNKPTWSTSKGPEIIDSQLETLQNLTQEIKESEHPDHGILDRISSAIVFYKTLRSEILKSRR